jgi:hypothetical protein
MFALDPEPRMPTVNSLIERINGIPDAADRDQRDLDDYEEGEIQAFFEIAERVAGWATDRTRLG